MNRPRAVFGLPLYAPVAPEGGGVRVQGYRIHDPATAALMLLAGGLGATMQVPVRLDNAVGTLGAAITSTTATSITFASAPPFATLSGGNWIILVLDPPSGTSPNASFEIVHLTAYTSGQTTGTISRAQGGSTAHTHLNGATWEVGPTVTDYGLAAVIADTSGAAAPSAGQVLTATSATAADWATPSPLATTVTGPDVSGAAAVVGTSASVARADHNHGLPTLPAVLHGEFVIMHFWGGSGGSGSYGIPMASEAASGTWMEFTAFSNTPGIGYAVLRQLFNTGLTGIAAYFEATLAGNGASTSEAELYDETASAAVTNSTVSVTAVAPTFVPARGGSAITLTAGHTYSVWGYNNTAYTSCYLGEARILGAF